MKETAQEVAVLANGCFWCTEAIFKKLKGVDKVEPGYTGGTIDHPTYEQVCTGTTQHAEALRIHFDASVISFTDLLEVFFATHDPTTLNRQGADVGTQYRSAVFYTTEDQYKEAVFFIEQLNKEHAFNLPVITEVVPAVHFWPAEAQHFDYYNNHPNQPYCLAVISPKVKKFQKLFAQEIKD